MSTENISEQVPKYACPHCGSDEVRDDFDTYPVFLAEGDRLVYLRSESAGGGLSELCCNMRDNFITDDLGHVAIE